MPRGREAVPDTISVAKVHLVGRLSDERVMGHLGVVLGVWHTRLCRASSVISPLITGVSQLRTRIMEMATAAAGVG